MSKEVDKLIKTLAIEFSKYVRLRDTDSNGYAKCVSCGEIKGWKDLECGHYISARITSTRFHEANAHAQCKGCNRGHKYSYNQGQEVTRGYHEYMLKNYPDELQILDVLKKSTKNYLEFELKELILKYRKKIKELKKTKSFTIN